MALVYNKFILFGDSITEFGTNLSVSGFHPRLQEDYARKLDVINRGFSGYNTDHAVLLFRAILQAEINPAKKNVKLLTIFFGTNDANQVDDYLQEVQGVPIERYQSNLTEIVQTALENNIKPILIGPALHDVTLGLASLAANNRPTTTPISTNRRNAEYCEAARSVAAKFGIPFIDLWSDFQQFGGWDKEDILDDKVDLSSLLPDGVHFSATAYKILYEKIIETIEKTYPELAPQSLPMLTTYWRDLDPKDIEGSLFAQN